MNNVLTPLKLYEYGYSVIPSGGGPEGKSPRVTWGEYQEHFPDENDIEKWSRDINPNLWGVVTGKISDVVIVDIDKPELKSLFDEAGLLPHTQTPRGGYHYWFRYPGHHVKTCVGIMPHVDVRGDGGFINVIGKRADGEYKTINLPTPEAVYAWDKLPPAIAEAIKASNNGHSKTPLHDERALPNLEPIPEGQRNDTLTREGGRLRRIGLPESTIYAALQDINNTRCSPPLPDNEIANIAKSVGRYLPGNSPIPPMVNTNVKEISMSPEGRDSYETGQISGQVGTSFNKNWGDLSRRFDEIIRENGSGWQDKRDIAGQLGTTSKDESFRRLINRRRVENKIRVHATRPELIQYINRDYKVTQLNNNEQQIYLDVKLPLSIHTIVQIPPGSVVGVAGYTSAGKTSFLLEAAELNVNQSKPIYYWYNEMSEARFKNRCMDFPKLYEAQTNGKFFPVKQQDWEFQDVQEPEGINLIDYLDRDDQMYLISQDIKALQARLSTGIVIFAIQKKPDQEFGYGGLPTAKLPNLYITLDKKEQTEKSFIGKAEIKKAKDWTDKNPVGLTCFYHTTGYYGKLEQDTMWQYKD